MSWAEIKKAINSNISKSLDVLITEKSNEIIDKILTSKIDSTEKIINLFSDSTYMNSVVQSESKCKAIIADDVLYNIIMSNSTTYSIFANSYIAMKALTGSKTRFSYLVETTEFSNLLNYSSFRNAMFDNASITEQILRDSSIAISKMMNYSDVSFSAPGDGTNHGNYYLIYSGKAFCFSMHHNSSGKKEGYIGECVVGDRYETLNISEYSNQKNIIKFVNPLKVGMSNNLNARGDYFII